jgi:KaiC/GvpD/RAD55 family RecA-like ATPase
MAKTKTVYFCTVCGNETPKWQGKCAACGAWNTIEEHIEKPVAAGKVRATPIGTMRTAQKLGEVTCEAEIRFCTGMGELDRVLGGGAVEGSLVLVGGAPGIGKSTLLLQICQSLCTDRKVLYVTGEESMRQVSMRAQRLGVSTDNLYILSETRLSDMLEAVSDAKPDILIVDSIQTMYNEENDSSPGSVSQVKDCTMALMQLSKMEGITVFVVGHINKDGAIAGPKVLEHMVDCVLYFEGDCVGTENPIKFILNITLYDKIDKQMSIGKESSVGRFVCELKKQKENVWRRLLKDEEMMNGINNMKIWFEMQERYKSEINNEDNNIDNTNNEDDDIDKEFDKIKKQMKAEKKRNKKRKKRKKRKASSSNKHINTDL